MHRALVILFVLCVRAGAALDGTGLNTSVAVDTVGSFGDEGVDAATNRLDFREAELLFYGPTDHLFTGRASFAAHSEGGAARVEIHEAYIGSTRLIPRSRFRVGQFFLGVGRLQRFHRHDWPFSTAPTVHLDMFDKEAVPDTGVEFSTLLPLPFYLDLTLGITNGWNFGHSHDIGEKPILPTHYARLESYLDLPWDGGVAIGGNYVGRQDNAGSNTAMFGLDTTAKWRRKKVVEALFQSEIWFRTTTAPPGETTNVTGFYFYPQYYLGWDFFLGTRLDYFTVLNSGLTTSSGQFIPIPNSEWALVPTLTYQPSEFSTIRLSYNHKWENQNGQQVRARDFVELQAVFFLGAHPAHEF